jgi:hypothetical protein
MDEFAGGCVVGDVEVLEKDFGEGAADDFDFEGLRGLDGPEVGAIDVAGNCALGGSFFDGVVYFLGGDSGSGLLGGGEGVGNCLRGGAGAGAVLDCDDGGLRRESFEAVPDGVLAFFSADGKGEGFGGFYLGGDFSEGGLQSVADDEDEVIDLRMAIEAFPRVGDERTARDFEKEFVDVRAHAGAFACGDDDGGGHSRVPWVDESRAAQSARTPRPGGFSSVPCKRVSPAPAGECVRFAPLWIGSGRVSNSKLISGVLIAFSLDGKACAFLKLVGSFQYVRRRGAGQ